MSVASTSSLAIWIPTYRRPEQLGCLIRNLHALSIPSRYPVFISDNDPDSTTQTEDPALLENIQYRRNPANLTAGVNFLRAFEVCPSEWVMILGDDDRLSPDAVAILEHTLREAAPDVCAVKFDSSLFGSQRDATCGGLDDYLRFVQRRHRADAFNNLCLVSNWIFRREPCTRHLSSAYLGYATKLSHLLPALRACREESRTIQFSSLQPVIHGSADEGWPKAASWYEMVVSLNTFSGFLDGANRRSLRKLILHGDWRRYAVKALRIQQFFASRSSEVRPWRIHWILVGLSPAYLIVLILMAPLLLLPSSLWPGRLRRSLGSPGSFDRW